LLALQKHVLNLQHTLAAAQQLYYSVTEIAGAVCEATGPDSLSIGIGCFPNIAKGICKIILPVTILAGYAILLAADIAHHVFYRKYEDATIGPDGDYYNFHKIKATYENVKLSMNFTSAGMKAIATNMKLQHTDMRSHLQSRHKQIRNQIGQDVADARNDIKGVIADARDATARGQRGMYENMNTLSEQLTESENRMKGDIVGAVNNNGNFIQTAGNSILHAICLTSQETFGGQCNNMIGPLEEGQSFIPVQYQWPEGERNMFERVHEIELGMKSLQTPRLIGTGVANEADDIETNPNQVESMMRKVDALSAGLRQLKDDVDDKFGRLKDDVHSKFVQALAHNKMLMESKFEQVLSQNKMLMEDLAEKLINSVGQATVQM